ncbi:acyltransferase family protein [uncultured Clostridium sp.]|uniref:acyltransferase family protein n=1 Tax=uncultured Clostridium sp. TaxID=59620 RepID=UPI0025D66DC2|nr:acyltransferase family protein [uncultured Clostridium sp.]
MENFNVLKFLFIIAIVFGHIGFSVSGNGETIHTFVYFYHIPLFFFLYGIMYKRESIVISIKKSLKELYFPFIITCVLFILLRNVFINLGFYKVGSVDSLSQMISARTFIDLFSFRYTEPLLGAIWIIPCLFFVNILYEFINLVIKKIKFFTDSRDIILPIIIVSLFVIGFNNGMNGGFFRFKFDIVLVALLFYYLGSEYARVKDKVKINYAVALGLFILMIQNLNFGFIDMNNRNYVNTAFFLFNSLVGIYINLAMVNFILWIKNAKFKKMMYIIGESIFWILALHFVIFKIVTLIKINIGNMSPDILQYIFPGDVSSLSWVELMEYWILGIFVPCALRMVYIKLKEYILVRKD